MVIALIVCVHALRTRYLPENSSSEETNDIHNSISKACTKLSASH